MTDAGRRVAPGGRPRPDSAERRVPPPSRHPILIRRVRRVLALIVSMAMLWALPAQAAETDPAAKRREIQREKARAAARVDVLRASDDEVESALEDLGQDIRGQEARAAAARQAAAVADEQVRQAKAAEAATTTELAELRTTMKTVAVDAYVQGPSKQLSMAAGATSINDLATKQYLIGVTANKGADTADQLRRARQDLEVLRGRAEAASGTAAARRRAVDARLKELRVAEEANERVAADVEARLESTLAEMASLEAVDQKLAAEIAERQRRIAAQLAARKAAAAKAAAAKVATARTPIPTAAPRASRSPSLPRVSGSTALTTVRGITVAASMADNLESLMAAAEADGFNLGGGGYRSSDGQVATRRANCGSSDYDIYEKPASECSPPTARPGQSMHEQGLAVDFTWNGQLIQSRGNAAFGWLSNNAGRFGLANLPREPWHWSTNGN